MWPWLKNGFKKFFTDEAAFSASFDKQVGRIRGLLLAAGAGLTAYGDQLAVAIPQYASRIKIGGIAIMGLSVMLRAGDKNEKMP